MKKHFCFFVGLVMLFMVFPMTQAKADPTSPVPQSGPMPNPPPPPPPIAPESTNGNPTGDFAAAVTFWLGVMLGR